MKIEECFIIRDKGLKDYQQCWQEMQHFTDHRNSTTTDEIWLVEHPPVFTQGQNGKPEHVLNAANIPVVKTDRGGQVTYHGPGQLVAYTLIDIQRKKFNIRQLVTCLEKTIIDLLKNFKIDAASKCKAPGVYVGDKKICSIGLRIRRGCSYHGLALNVAMDLAPFTQINPCGFPQLEMIQMQDLVKDLDRKIVINQFIESLQRNLGYTHLQFANEKS